MWDGLEKKRLDVVAGDAERARKARLELCVSDIILNNLVADATGTDGAKRRLAERTGPKGAGACSGLPDEAWSVVSSPDAKTLLRPFASPASERAISAGLTLGAHRFRREHHHFIRAAAIFDKRQEQLLRA
jgi:hypothetical protein